MLNAKKANTKMRWVNGIAQLADSLTKFADRKAFLQFMSQKQFWRLVDDPTVTAGRKINKKILEQKMKETEDFFYNAVAEMAKKCNWPWVENDPVSYSPLT